MKKQLRKLSVIIPAYNEEDAIEAEVKSIQSVLNEHNYSTDDIIVVNDGSTDNTAINAKNAGAKVITQPINMGYGHSLKTGINASKHPICVMTDADGTYPFDKLPLMFEEFDKGFDLVVGQRHGKAYKGSIFKFPLRLILKAITEYVAGKPIADINSGFRIFKKKSMLPFMDLLCNTFSFSTSQTLSFLMTGKTVQYVKIPYEKRIGQSKVKLFKDSIRTLQYILQMTLYFNPFKIFMLLSTLMLSSSILCLILSVWLQIKTGFLLGAGGLLSSVLVFCLGLVAELLRQILLQLKSVSND